VSDVAVRADRLSKRYRLGERRGHRTLREALVSAARAPFSRRRERQDETIWALRDVSFEIRHGEVVGVIGRNGAGKSTLLKILSRITEPTSGRAELYGRVGSLLEVGTGFHSELTGRENIYLSGAILGLRRAEIQRKFDEIVAFAEVERFIDTPVKRFSSGMFLRLAFAVAAHLEPEILLVDEVLAVGDASFQKRCIGKMSAVASEGRTVLFVSHNMGVLRELAARGILLDAGALIADSGIAAAIDSYMSSLAAASAVSVDLGEHAGRLPGMRKLIRSVQLKRDGSVAASADYSQDDVVVLEIEYRSPEVRLAGAGMIVYSITGVRVGGFNTYMAFQPPHSLPPAGRVTFRLPARGLTPGQYVITVSVGSHSGGLEDKIEGAIAFSVHPADIYGTGYLLSSEDGVAALQATATVDEH
jgi:lipopolysaccharide transport system ATP-binding protein